MVSYATTSVCKILVLFLIIVLPGIVYQYKRGLHIAKILFFYWEIRLKVKPLFTKILGGDFSEVFLRLNIEKIASQRNSNDQLYVNRFFVSSEGHFLSLRKFINHLATILTQLYHECLQIFPYKYMNCR